MNKLPLERRAQFLGMMVEGSEARPVRRAKVVLFSDRQLGARVRTLEDGEQPRGVDREIPSRGRYAGVTEKILDAA
jgi:hypothetical protein